MRSRNLKKTQIERRTIGYVRVSSAEQANEGVSLAAQEARIGLYGAAMGFDVSEVISDRERRQGALNAPASSVACRRAARRDRTGRDLQARSADPLDARPCRTARTVRAP